MTNTGGPADPAHVAILAGIRLLTVQAQTNGPSSEQPPRTELDMRIGFESSWDDTGRLLRYTLIYDLQQHTDGPTVELSASYEVVFDMPTEFNDEATVMQQFERTVVALAVHPYLRSLASRLVTDMGLTAAHLPLLRPSNLQPVTGDS